MTVRLVLDDEHYGYARPDGSEGQRFQVPPGADLVVDFGGYRFEVPGDWGWEQPDRLVFMRIGRPEVVVRISGPEQQVVFSPPLEQGEEVMLMIGRDEGGFMQACYMAMINVTPSGCGRR